LRKRERIIRIDLEREGEREGEREMRMKMRIKIKIMKEEEDIT
jgi:hypothetical protein